MKERETIEPEIERELAGLLNWLNEVWGVGVKRKVVDGLRTRQDDPEDLDTHLDRYQNNPYGSK